MRPRPFFLSVFSAVFLLASSTSPLSRAQTPLPWVQAKGSKFVDPTGQEVTLRGCNIGNWLLLEMWMLAIDHAQFPDQFAFEANLRERFGEAEKDRLMEVYREHWITPRDFEIIRSFGFNVIRLPFNYRLLEDDDAPGRIKPDGIKSLDRAIDMAEDAGLYVILDMHGVPGGQSIDHPTGRVGQNKLWGDPVYADRTAALWKKIAERYRDRSSVAGYDVINEPYGDWGQTDVRPKLRDIFEQIYHAIREVDDRHVIFAPAPMWGGLGFYGNPHENGWTHVAFTEHHYPGLFGSDPSLKTHSNFIHRDLPAKQAELEAVQTPMFIGEWNPVFERLGGGDLMRRYFDEYVSYGWAATIWSYKILHREGGVIDDNWYMVSNAEPLNRPNFETASKEEIEAYFKWFGSMAYVIDEPMRQALTRREPVPVDLPVPPPPMKEAPSHDAIPGWTATDVGGALPGGQRRDGARGMTIYGGGRDIWGAADEFRFVSRSVSGEFVLTATIDSLGDTHTYAKAGLMARADLSPDAAHVLLHVIPSGQVVLGRRDRAGAGMTELRVDSDVFPVHLRLASTEGQIRAAYSTDATTWTPIGQAFPAQALGEVHELGLAVLSHDAGALTEARFSEVRLKKMP